MIGLVCCRGQSFGITRLITQLSSLLYLKSSMAIHHLLSDPTYTPGTTAVEEVDSQLRSRDEILAMVKRNLHQAQARMKLQYDKKHIERHYKVGDWVYLKIQPYRQQTVASKDYHKLSSRYYGPFQVIEKVGTVAYKLKLPPTARIHNVVHVSLLKRKIGPTVTVEVALPPVQDSSTLKWTPAVVLETRMIKHRGVAATQWLIHWLGSSPEEATWDMADEIRNRYLDFEF